MPTSALDIRAVDDLTFEVGTEGVFPLLPEVMKFDFLLQKKLWNHTDHTIITIQIRRRKINQIDFL